MVEAGADPMQVLRFATSATAELLGIGNETGTLEPEKAADPAAGDSLENSKALREVRLVVRGGAEVGSSNGA